MKPSSCGVWRDGMSAQLLYVPTCPVCWLVVTARRYEIELLHTSHLHTPLTLWKPRLIASTHRGRPFHTPIPSSSPGSVSTLHILLVMVYGSKSANSGVRYGYSAPFVLRPLLVDGFKTPLQTSQSMHCVLVVDKNICWLDIVFCKIIVVKEK